jgi:DNA-binding response OmpR family regulator
MVWFDQPVNGRFAKRAFTPGSSNDFIAFSFFELKPYESDPMKKILLLDDNEDILEIVKDILVYAHFEVKPIINSIGLLPVAEEFQPDLIILDYCLADGNGGELCKAIKAHHYLQFIPVIIFSAYTQPNLDFQKFGCDAVISKPFDLDEFFSIVNGLLNIKQVQSVLEIPVN